MGGSPTLTQTHLAFDRPTNLQKETWALPKAHSWVLAIIDRRVGKCWKPLPGIIEARNSEYPQPLAQATVTVVGPLGRNPSEGTGTRFGHKIGTSLKGFLW